MRTVTAEVFLLALLSVATANAFTGGGSSTGRSSPPIVQQQQQHSRTTTGTVLSKHPAARLANFPPPVPPLPLATIRRRQEKKEMHHLQALPTSSIIVAPHVWTSLVPPCMGFYKSEYTVSLGYGLAVAGTAISLLRQFNPIPPSVALTLTLHAYALIFYGLRLNVFLVLRNIWSRRIQEFNTRIEDRAVARGSRWTTRAPFILSCGMLYYGLVIPLWFTGKLLAGSSTLEAAAAATTTATATAAAAIPSWATKLLKVLIGAQWLGFGIAALGDFTKTYVKISEKNERYLVTSGIFSFIRHPNYSGEILGWTSNALAGLVAAGLWIPTLAPTRPTLATAFTNLTALAIGWIGILFVLLRATSNLEARQKTDYGESTKYQKWVASSWGGWQLPKPKTHTAAGTDNNAGPQLKLDPTVEEGSGSGI